MEIQIFVDEKQVIKFARPKLEQCISEVFPVQSYSRKRGKVLHRLRVSRLYQYNLRCQGDLPLCLLFIVETLFQYLAIYEHSSCFLSITCYN